MQKIPFRGEDKRKTQAAVVILVTILFVIKALAVPSNSASSQNDTQAEEEMVVGMRAEADVVITEASLSAIEPETIEYIPPDVSGIEETYISEEAYTACMRYGEEYDISPELLMAVIERESKGDPTAFNGTDSGLMQVAQKWHYDRMERLGVTDLFDTDQNIHTGADFLAELFDKYGDVSFVLMVYNMGYDMANKYYSQGVISEYAQEIIARADELSLLHAYGGK